jgi:hypothetical protein
VRIPITSSAFALVAVGCATVLAGCGGTRLHGGASRPAAADPIEYSDCMRAHGVPNFPDPGPAGQLALPSSIDPHAPAFRAARRRCASLQPAAVAPPRPSERRRRQAVIFSRCVRAHGLPDFPDPSLTVPAPGDGSGIIRGGLYWHVTAGTVTSPAFRRASVACGWRLAQPVANAQ